MKTLNSLSSLPNDVILETENPNLSNNRVNHLSGLAIMLMNKIRRSIVGYTSARGFDHEDVKRAINYDFRVIKRWLDYLEVYEKGAASIEGKSILELGPGADLGIGLTFLAAGAKQYNALDVHNLVEGTPQFFYDELFTQLQKDPNHKVEVDTLRKQLDYTLKGENDRLNYRCSTKFDLTIFEGQQIDLVVSNSAFQQFDNPEETIRQISELTPTGAKFVALIDLKTHPRWIKQRDPLNIYRYPDPLYNMLKFRGSQNRIRPRQFQVMLEAQGWKNVRIIPRIQLDHQYLTQVNNSLHQRFQSSDNQMEILTCVICATKG